MIGEVLLSTFIITLISFSGMLTLVLKKNFEKTIIILIGLAAGALMGGAFIHLLPESIIEFNDPNTFNYVLLGFIAFFLIEKTLHWHHCRQNKCDKCKTTIGYMNLIAEAIHNFIDGLIIAGSYAINSTLGITTTIAVALHEVPQEIGDFGVLVYSGYKKKKALIVNYIISLTVILGGLFGYYLIDLVSSIEPVILPIAAGGFIYIAASDLIPELKESKKLIKVTISFLIGVALMYLIKLI